MPPLGFRFIGLQDVFAPDAVTALDEAEDPQGVDIVAEGEAVGLDQGLRGLDMGPGALLGDEFGVEEFAAEVIERGDQGPFLAGEGGPEVDGSVMLDEGPGGGGKYLPVVSLLFGMRLVATQFLGASDDGSQGDVDVLFLQAVAHRGVIVAGDG